MECYFRLILRWILGGFLMWTLECYLRWISRWKADQALRKEGACNSNGIFRGCARIYACHLVGVGRQGASCLMCLNTFLSHRVLLTTHAPTIWLIKTHHSHTKI